MRNDCTRQPLRCQSRCVSVVAQLVVFAAVVAVALVFCCAVPSRARAEVTADRWVFLGDSYATVRVNGHYVKKAWPEYLKKTLKLKDSQVKVKRGYGRGFSTHCGRWVERLKRSARDPRVGHVLIVGGAGNDLDYSIDSVVEGYGKLMRIVRKKYPNARIAHAITSWNFNSSWYRKKLRKRYKWYRKLADRYDVVYLKGCESAIRTHRGWVCSDGNHPNKKGCIGMTKIIYKRMKALDFI